MRKKRVTRYACEWCRRSWAKPSPCERHERHCFKRPDREPHLGELTKARAMGRLVNFPIGDADAYPAGMDWVEWVAWGDSPQAGEVPLWWPGPGKIWNGDSWENVQGWFFEYPTGAHGCAGGPAPEDHWPAVAGIELDKIPAYFRIEALNSAWIPAFSPRSHSLRQGVDCDITSKPIRERLQL